VSRQRCSTDLPKRLGIDRDVEVLHYWWLKQISRGLELTGQEVTDEEVDALQVKIPLDVFWNEPRSPAWMNAVDKAAEEARERLGGDDGARRWVSKVRRALDKAFDDEMREMASMPEELRQPTRHRAKMGRVVR